MDLWHYPGTLAHPWYFGHVQYFGLNQYDFPFEINLSVYVKRLSHIRELLEETNDI